MADRGKNNFGKFAIGTLIAGAAGFVAGLLTAPKSGKQTRTDIRNAADSTVNEAEKQLKKLHTELNDLIGEAKHRSADVKGKTKDELDDLTEKATLAKQKAREIISAIHEGEADNKDLQKALKEAGKAIKHLRTYLKK